MKTSWIMLFAAVAGLTAARITSCIRSVSVQNVSSPKVSNRKMSRPSVRLRGFMGLRDAAGEAGSVGVTGPASVPGSQAASCAAMMNIANVLRGIWRSPGAAISGFRLPGHGDEGGVAAPCRTSSVRDM